MAHTLSQQSLARHYSTSTRRSAWSRFIQWATLEDAKHHFGWVGALLTVQATIILPGTMLAIAAGGASFGLIMVVAATFAAVVITNLAALSTRYTIPVFFICLLINVATILVSLFS